MRPSRIQGPVLIRFLGQLGVRTSKQQCVLNLKNYYPEFHTVGTGYRGVRGYVGARVGFHGYTATAEPSTACCLL